MKRLIFLCGLLLLGITLFAQQKVKRGCAERPKAKFTAIFFISTIEFPRLLQASIFVFANNAWRDFSRLDRHRLINHALGHFVVNHFDMARDREVFAERVANKAVIRQDAAQIVMAFKHDAK